MTINALAQNDPAWKSNNICLVLKLSFESYISARSVCEIGAWFVKQFKFY